MTCTTDGKLAPHFGSSATGRTSYGQSLGFNQRTGFHPDILNPADHEVWSILNTSNSAFAISPNVSSAALGHDLESSRVLRDSSAVATEAGFTDCIRECSGAAFVQQSPQSAAHLSKCCPRASEQWEWRESKGRVFCLSVQHCTLRERAIPSGTQWGQGQSPKSSYRGASKRHEAYHWS